MFSQVSVCPRGKVYPPGQSDTPLGQTSPRSDSPLVRHPQQVDTTPWTDTPPGQTLPLGRHPLLRQSPGQTPQPPPRQMATAADSTHPPGMHSCLHYKNSGGSRTSPTVGANLLDLFGHIFSRKLHENERNWTKRGAHVPRTPPWIRR